MMEYIRYYPLVRIDTDGTDYTAMTPTDSEKTVRERHALWLSEVVPNYFRLGARDRLSVSAVNSLRLHCPKCGAELKTITVVTEERTLPLYACDNCTVRR